MDVLGDSAGGRGVCRSGSGDDLATSERQWDIMYFILRNQIPILFYFDQRTIQDHTASSTYLYHSQVTITFLHTLPRPSGTEWPLLGLFALRLSIHFFPRGLTFTLISLFSDPRHSFSWLDLHLSSTFAYHDYCIVLYRYGVPVPERSPPPSFLPSPQRQRTH